MRCSKVRRLLVDYLFGLADPKRSEEIREHVSACERCQGALRTVEREYSLFKEWPLVAPRPGLVDRTMHAVKAAREGRTRGAQHRAPQQDTVWQWLTGRWAWRVAALLVVGVAGAVACPSVAALLRHEGVQETFVLGSDRIVPGETVRYQAFVRDGASGAPVRSAQVKLALVSQNGRRTWDKRVRTDEYGVAVIQEPIASQLAGQEYTLTVRSESPAGENQVLVPVIVRRPLRVLGSTDLSRCRPGEQVRISALVTGEDSRPVADCTARFALIGTAGQRLWQGSERISGLGVATALCRVPDDAPDGRYTVTGEVDGREFSRNLRVDTRRERSILVRISTDKGFCVPEENMTGRVIAIRGTGEPLAGGKVRVTFTDKTDRSTPLGTLDGTTDKKGEFAFVFPLRIQFKGDSSIASEGRVSVDATAIGPDGIIGRDQQTLYLTVRPLRIKTVVAHKALAHGTESSVHFVVFYADGRPARVTLNIQELDRTLTTSEFGIATTQVVPFSTNVRLTAEAQDTDGLRARETFVLPVSSNKDSTLLHPYRHICMAGEAVNLSVSAPESIPFVFLSAASSQRTEIQTRVYLEKGRGTFALNLPPDITGTIAISACYIRTDGSVASDTRRVQVLRKPNLSVAAAWDAPDAEATGAERLRLSVTGRDGRPAAAALVLASPSAWEQAEAMISGGEPRASDSDDNETEKAQRRWVPAVSRLVADAVVRGETTKELDQAVAALDYATNGSDGAHWVTGETMNQKMARIQQERMTHERQLAMVVCAVPVALYVILLVPVLVLGIGTALGRETVRTGSVEETGVAARTLARLNVLWGLGFYGPFVGGLTTAVLLDHLGVPAGGTFAAVLAAVLAGCVFALLVVTVRRLRDEPATARTSEAGPLLRLRKLSQTLPAAYGCAILCLLLLWLAGTWGMSYARAAKTLSGIVFLFFVAGGGALAGTRRIAAQTWGLKSKFWALIARPVALGLPLILTVLVLGMDGAASRGTELARLYRPLVRPEQPGVPTAPPPPMPGSTLTQAGFTSQPSATPFAFSASFDRWLRVLHTDSQGAATIEVPAGNLPQGSPIRIVAVSGDGEFGYGKVGLNPAK